MIQKALSTEYCPSKFLAQLKFLLLSLLGALALGAASSTLAATGSGVTGTVAVRVSGLDAPLKANTLAFLSIYKETRPAGFTLFDAADTTAEQDKRSRVFTALHIERLHQLAPGEIEQALQPFGYYSPTLTSTLKNPEPKSWEADYKVVLGPRTAYAKVVVEVVGEGARLPVVVQRVAQVQAQQGRGLDHAFYQSNKGALLTDLASSGYLDARFTKAVLRVNPTAQTADLQWQLDTGSRYYFGPVVVAQDVLRDSFVARYHNITAGEPFSTARLVDLQIRLNDTNYFNSVVLEVDRDEAVDFRIPVTLRAQPAKRRRYTAGVGFGTDTGPRISAGIEARRVNNRGHKYRLQTRFSAISNELQGEYEIPIKNVAKDRVLVYAGGQQREVADADTTTYLVGVAREDDWGPFRRRLFFNLEREQFEIGNAPQQQSTLAYPGINLAFDRVDNPKFVRRGYSLALQLHGGLESLGSKVDFTAIGLSGRGVLGFGSRWRLITAAEAAWVDTDDFSALPPSQRLYAGGDRSVRGYGFQSISPENASGDDIGGRYLASASVEVDYQVGGAWLVAAFVDAGEASEQKPNDFKLGVGLGIRYRSPVGMIRFDVAHPLDDPDNSFRVHVSIGPDL